MKKILIIDDEELIRKMLTKFLEKNGYKVMVTHNGDQGIKLFKEIEPDIIITDLLMPDKEGLETIIEIKKIDPDVKIIAISGGGKGDPKMYLNLASKLGANRTFTKPVDTDVLLVAIEEIIFK